MNWECEWEGSGNGDCEWDECGDEDEPRSQSERSAPAGAICSVYICKATDSDREGNLVYATEYIAQRPVPVENRANPAFSSPFQYFSSFFL